jgi:hypothetical protein
VSGDVSDAGNVFQPRKRSEAEQAAYAEGYVDCLTGSAKRMREEARLTGYAEALVELALPDAPVPPSTVTALRVRPSADWQHIELCADDGDGELVVARLDQQAAVKMTLMASEYLLLWNGRTAQEERAAAAAVGEDPAETQRAHRPRRPRRHERSLARPRGRR